MLQGNAMCADNLYRITVLDAADPRVLDGQIIRPYVRNQVSSYFITYIYIYIFQTNVMYCIGEGISASVSPPSVQIALLQTRQSGRRRLFASH